MPCCTSLYTYHTAHCECMWGHCIGSLPPSVHNADTPVSVSKFLNEHEFLKEFFRVVNPRFSLMRRQRKEVIPQDVASHISAATNDKEAQEILFAHMTRYANVNTLREYCDVIIGAKGFPNKRLFGAKMKEELQQGGWWSV